jgi:hypothetical protein
MSVQDDGQRATYKLRSKPRFVPNANERARFVIRPQPGFVPAYQIIDTSAKAVVSGHATEREAITEASRLNGGIE